MTTMKISELTDAPAWLKDANTEDADVEIRDGIVTWHNGVWRGTVAFDMIETAYRAARATVSKGWTDDLRPVRVAYGEDLGLVSLRYGILLASVWGTGNFSVSAEVEPVVTVCDSEMMELYGAEHCWDDVIALLREKLDWETGDWKQNSQ